MYKVKNGLTPIYITEIFNTARSDVIWATLISIFHVFAQYTVENILYDNLGPIFGIN